MAKISFKMPEEFIKRIEALSDNREAVITKCLEAAGEIVEKEVKNSLYDVLSPEERNGELINSLGLTPAMIDKNGVYNVKIGFSGMRGDGKKNALVGAILEYGTKDGRQPPRPYMKPAKNRSQKAAIEAMIKTFDEEVKK